MIICFQLTWKRDQRNFKVHRLFPGLTERSFKTGVWWTVLFINWVAVKSWVSYNTTAGSTRVLLS